MEAATNIDQEVQDVPPQGGEPVLAQEHRQKLDSIVIDLYKKKAPKEVVQAIVKDFKTKYAKQPVAQSSGITPAATKYPNYLGLAGIPSIEEAAQRAKEKHDNAVLSSQKTVSDLLDNDESIKKIAKSILDDQVKRKVGEELSKGLRQEPYQQFNFDMNPVKEEHIQGLAESIKATPAMQVDALMQAKKIMPEKAKDIDKSIYILNSTDRAVSPEKQNQISENADKIQKGELIYKPKTGQLIKPEDLGESLHTASKRRNDDIDLFDLADNGSREDLIKKLNQLVINQDPDVPTPQPSGFGGKVGEFMGGQGKITAQAFAAQAANLVAPGSGEVLAAGLYAHEFARRGFSNELQRSYAAFKKQGLSDDEALDKAETQAKVAMTTDAATAAIMGKATSSAGNKLLNSATVKEAVKLGNEGGWYNGVIKNGFDFIKKEAPVGIKNASLAGGGELAKNIAANVGGQDRDLGEGVAGAAGNMLALHYTLSAGMGLLGHFGTKGIDAAKPIYKKVMQGFTKVPIEDAKIIAAEQIQAGNITPQDAARVLEDIEAHKELDGLIPKSVKNDEVRLQLQDIVKKREATAEEKSKVSAAFAEPLKLKIEKYDEKINEIVNSPEAKQESPAQPATEKTASDLFITAAVNGDIKGTYAEMVKSDPKQADAVIKDIAEQAQGVDSEGKPLAVGARYEDMVKDYPKEIIDAAIKEYPKKKPVVTVSTPNIVNVKLKENAIPEQSANAMDVQPETRNGEAVGGGDIQPKEVTGTQSEPIVSDKESTQPQGISDKEKLDPYGLPFENEPQDKRSGIKNAISDAIRFERQLPKVDLPKMGKDVEVLAEGKRLVDSGEINPWEVVDRVLDKKEGMQPNEAKAMQYYMHQLDSHEVELRSKISEAETPVTKAELGGRLQQLSDEMDAATEANIISGRAWSDVGNIRQIVTDQSFNPSRERSFIKDAYGGEIPEHVKIKLDAITKERDAAIAAKIKVEEQLRQKMAAQGFEKIKEQAKKTAKKAETKELLKKEEQDLLDELRKAFKKDIGNINAGIPIPVETIEVLGKLAINYVKQGINGLDSLVDKIHAGIPEDSGLSKKQLRDILIDYDPLTATTETKRINKKADLLEDKITPAILKTKNGKVAGHSEPTDFNKPSRVQKEFRSNTEWVKAQQRVANADYKIKVIKRQAFESDKNMYQKFLAWTGRLTRLSVLSGYNVLGKLASAATVGSLVKRIPEQAIGAVYSKIFSGISKKAPIEGGFNWLNAKAEARFYREFFHYRWFKAIKDILITGSSDLSKRLGSAEYEHVPVLYLPTDLHQIIKDPPKRATFQASFKNGLIWAEKNGLDINDVLVINSLENAAYKRAQYEIFQEQNWLSRKFTSWKSKMEKSGNLGATGKFLADFMIPVSTVPTNIVRRVVTTSPIGLIRGTAEVVNAYRKGIESLTPEQADHVMMQLKQGTLGTALWLIGWYGAGQFGGLYSKFNPDKQRKEGALKHDEMSVGGKMIPKPTQHALPLEIIQFAATARHVYDNYRDNKHESTPQALYSAGMGSIGALVEQIPVIETAAHMVGAVNNPYESEKLKDDVQRRFEPQILRETGIIKKKEKPPPALKATKGSRERKVNSRERIRK